MHIVLFYINVREYRKGHANWIIQKYWQHMMHKTQEKDNKNTAQYMLDTTMLKQTQLT